ncbi:restriction endonuclease [Pseudomonas sp. MNR3A]|uniref:restriction endonuclease n=1 Tax=Pseudomonas sp. MNR3A TaxID=2615213 RepID=UPI00129AE2C6|nr:restriction endonuclease [Pseudomonas sp. MNR3A]
MKAKNDGKFYESMVFWAYTSLCKDERLTSVERDVKVPSPDGPRQIDVLVKHEHAGVIYTTIVECRDYSGKLNVTHVDAFASKLADVKASKGILVSRKGFSKTAVQKANRLGIGLCIVDSADTMLKELVIEVPAIIKVVHPSLQVKTLMKNNSVERKVAASAFTTINDIPLRNLVIQELREGVINIPEEPITLDWKPSSLNPPFFVRDADGFQVEVPWFTVTLHINIWYLFGHTNNLPDFVSQTHLGNSTHNVFIPSRFKIGLNQSFVRYEKYSKIPCNHNETIVGAFIPDTDTPISSTYGAQHLNIET